MRPRDASDAAACPHCQAEPSQKFCFTYLPKDVELLFKEALTCHASACHNAFASMARRTAQAMFASLGESSKLKLFNELAYIRDIAEIDGDTYVNVRKVLFGSDGDPKQALPALDAYQSGILLEALKDLLYQAFVRKGRLQQAVMVRRFFVDESKVTKLNRA